MAGLIKARVLVQLTERLVHLVSLVLQYELVEYLAREYLGLPSPLVVDNTPVVRLVSHRVVEDYC